MSIESGTSAIWIWFSPIWAVEPCVTCSCFINSNWIIYIQDWSDVGTKDNLRTSQVAHALMAQGGDLYGWGPRFNIHWDNTLLLEFSFLRSNSPDANIVIITNFVCLWKTRLHCHIVSLVKHFTLKGYCDHCVSGVVYTGDVINSMCSIFKHRNHSEQIISSSTPNSYGMFSCLLSGFCLLCQIHNGWVAKEVAWKNSLPTLIVPTTGKIYLKCFQFLSLFLVY